MTSFLLQQNTFRCSLTLVRAYCGRVGQDTSTQLCQLCLALPSSAQLCPAQPSGPSLDPHAWISGAFSMSVPTLSYMHMLLQLESLAQSFCGANPLCVQCPNCSGGGGPPQPAIFLNQGLRKVWKGDLSSSGSHMVSVTITQFCSSTTQTVGEDS